jgi:hypothetical protein
MLPRSQRGNPWGSSTSPTLAAFGFGGERGAAAPSCCSCSHDQQCWWTAQPMRGTARASDLEKARLAEPQAMIIGDYLSLLVLLGQIWLPQGGSRASEGKRGKSQQPLAAPRRQCVLLKRSRPTSSHAENQPGSSRPASKQAGGLRRNESDLLFKSDLPPVVLHHTADLRVLVRLWNGCLRLTSSSLKQVILCIKDPAQQADPAACRYQGRLTLLNPWLARWLQGRIQA